MDEANHRLRSMGAAIMALARQRAIKAAKREFQRQGLKPAAMGRHSFRSRRAIRAQAQGLTGGQSLP